MSESVMWIIPEAPAPAAARAAARRTPVAKGLRFGILDNSKSNADELLDTIIEGVKAKYPDAVIVRTRKPSAASPASADVLDRLEQETDVVVSAMAD